MPRRHSGRQALVDTVFRRCMQFDERTLDDIRAAIRQELKDIRLRTGASVFGRPGHPVGDDVIDWQPSDHDLQIMISRNCMGEGEWEFYPAYSTPPRYVSRQRVLQLVQVLEEGHGREQERQALKDMLADLRSGVQHWKAKHARARAKAVELHELEVDVTNRAFAGHVGELL